VTESVPFADAGNAQHAYDEPGEYIVTAQVVDVNTCTSVNFQPLQVLVSTIPIFNAEVTSPICTDVPGVLNGNPVQSVSWTALPPLAESDTAALPDDLGIPFISELTVDFFEEDQTLDDCDDLLLVTANIEHTFVGDLSMSVICPNGTEVVLMENNSFNDDIGGCMVPDVNPNNLGIADVEGFDYSWNMNATYVLDDPSNPNLDDPIPAGTYLPCGDLCDFVGCPLNGIWQFVIEDSWGGDNGTLFNWNIDFNPDIVPDVTTFTPVIGMESDSSYWDVVLSDPNVVAIDDDGNSVDVMYANAGSYGYNFVVTNNFGCQWDTTVNVQVIENPGAFISAGMDQIWCNGSTPVQLEASLDGLSDVTPECGGVAGIQSYCYGALESTTFTYCPDSPGDGTRIILDFLQGETEAGWDAIWIYDGQDTSAPLIGTIDGDITGASFEACNFEGCLTIQFTSDFSVSCQDNGFTEAQWEVSCTGEASTCGYDWEWSPAQYLDDSLIPNPTLTNFGVEPIEFTVSVEPAGYDNCAATATVMVEPAFDFEVDSQQPTCLENDGVIVVDLLTPVSDPQGPFTVILQVQDEITGNYTDIETMEWTSGASFGHYDLVPGTYAVSLFNADGCVYSQVFVMEEAPELLLDIPNIQTICLGGTANLTVSSPQDPLNIWTYQWGNGLPNGPVQQVSPNTSTVYTVQGFDQNGCPTDEYQIGVNVLSPINADLVASDFLCSGEEAYLDASASNGGSGTGYTYTWSFEGNILSEDEESIWTIPPSTGEYCVTVNDDCETPAATVCTDVVLETPVSIAFSADTTEACGQGTFLFTNETDPALITSSLWAFGDGTYAGESNTVKTFQSPGFYDVSLTVTSAAGGCEYTQVQEAYINVYPIPQVGFFAGPQPTRAPETTIDFDGYSNASVVEWFWTFNTYNPLGYSFEQDPTFQFPVAEGGIYPVQLQITDSHGCINVVNRQIEIQGMFNLFIPTSFTPNNDGHNDAFFVEGTDIDPDRFEFEIWNRWGELIWSTTDPTDAWYGQVGEEGQHYVPNGPYMYRIEVHSLEEESYRKEVFGVVTIIR